MIVEEIIRIEDDKTLSFGNYVVKEKQKITDFDVDGDIYKIRTHNEVTRLSKNGKIVLETVPGAAVFNLSVTDKKVTFKTEGYKSTLITLELEPNESYAIYIDDVYVDKEKANMSGKISFSIDLNDKPQSVRIEKHN
jgi:hypothetical protein